MMARYIFGRTKAMDCDSWEGDRPAAPTVVEREPYDTGILDQYGVPIYRAPNPVGFCRDDEW